MDKLFKAFKRRLMLLCMAFLVFIMAGIHATVYFTSYNIIEEQLVSGTKGVAVSIANSLAWHIEEYKSFLETRDVQSDYYVKTQAYFADIKANSRIKYISTERKVNDEIIEYILDSEPIGSQDYSPPGDTEPIDPRSELTYSTGVPFGFKITSYESWGKLLGAYAPIFDNDGEMLGLVCVHIDSLDLYSYMNKLHIVLLGIYIVILGLSWLSLSKYSRSILDPMLKDKLTGAYSKRYFEKMLHEEISRAVKYRMGLALMMLDLDHFKNVNDTYGHVFGDKVLSSISEIVRKTIRPSDYFIRYGGEEFAVLMTDSNDKPVLEVAERIRRAIEDSPIFNEEKNIPVKMTISIGVACFDRVSLNAKELIENADRALYVAKVKRNMVALFDGKARSKTE